MYIRIPLFGRDLHLSQTNRAFLPGFARFALRSFGCGTIRLKGWGLKPVLAGRCCASSVLIIKDTKKN